MSLLTRSLVSTQFKLGVYQLRQITRIERGGVVISGCDSRYQPDGGVRHELTPDEWFIYSWHFFPRYAGQYFCDEESLLREIYYDYFAKERIHRQSNMFLIYKNDKSTGYMLTESFGDNIGRFYNGMFVNDLGSSTYQTTDDYGMVKPIEYAKNCVEAAACMLSDINGFRKVIIDLDSLKNDCEDSPEACTLYAKLKKLLPICSHTHLYLKK